MSTRWTARTLALLLFLAFGTSAARAYDAIYVFGDSYSDVGNDFYVSSPLGHPTPPSPPYFEGRFSNGPIWVEHLAGSLNLTITPSETGGTDYAFGGAELLSPVITPLGPIPSVVQQVEAYLLANGGKADPKALYVLTGGGNDILNAIGTSVSPEELGTKIGWGLAGLELKLKKAGAKSILLPNLLDVGQLPAAAADPSFATKASSTANRWLAGLRWCEEHSKGVELYQPDVFSLFRAIETAKTHYGFTNITAPCLTVVTPCADPDHTLWWDAEHPTEFGHSFFAVLAEGSLSSR